MQGRIARFHNIYGPQVIAFSAVCLQVFVLNVFEYLLARIRQHTIYPHLLQGTWKGGREKAPAAFCRKGFHSAS
jgi:hypothetical protein